MTVSANWRGNPLGEGYAAFVVDRTVDLTDAWANVVGIRAWSGDADVVAQVTAQGLTANDVAERAVVKRVIFQNLTTASDAQVSRAAGAGTPPSPSNAYLTAQADGGGVTLDSPTRLELVNVQAKLTTGTGTANVIVWFDVPDAA